MNTDQKVKFLVKWNGGRFALLCNRCSQIIREDFNPDDLENKTYFCKFHSEEE